MGRKPTVNLNLPPRMRRKVMVSGKCHYYYDLGGKPRKWLPLGSDYHSALKQYADLEINTNIEKPTFNQAAERYMLEVSPLKARATHDNDKSNIKHLLKFFDGAPLDEIRPLHISQFLDFRRKTPSSANNCVALFSGIFNCARRWGLTDLANPCVGREKHKESGRDVYIDTAMYAAVYQHAGQPLRDFLDLLYLTGQRPADVVKMDERDIKDGVLYLSQNKTKTRLRINVIGELADVIERIRVRRIDAKVISTKLVIGANGSALTYDAMLKQFQKAREQAGISKEAFQMRDLRAKAATDKEETMGIKDAQNQLGHASEAMTKHYVRNRRGKLVNPTR